jgi:hypothetical protein
MPEQRGGADLDLGDEEGFVGALKKAAGVSYSEIAKRTIGRWAGDRIALVGDYAKRDDLPPEDDADLIYDLCGSDEDRWAAVEHYRNYAEQTGNPKYKDKADRLAAAQLYRDITDDVCAVIEHELQGKFKGDGWRDFEYDNYEVKIVEKRR